MRMSLSIVIPAYNEEARIGASVLRILELVNNRGLDAELIVVDDGSMDLTIASAEKACAEFPALKTRIIAYDENRGKGFAVKKGLLAAENEIALFTDADLSTPIEEYEKLVGAIEDDEFDVSFGSRALDRSLIGEHQPWRREQGGKVFNLFMRALTGLPYWDTQCGFKAFRMDKFRPLLENMTIDRFGFDVEFLFVAYRAGLRLTEVPVRWNNDDRTKVKIFRDSIRMFNEVREIRRNAKRGVYDNH